MTVPFLIPDSDTSFKAALRALAAKFKAEGLDTPDLDARFLLMDAAGVDRTALVTHGDDRVPADKLRTLESFANRRLAGEPIDSILGHSEFYGRRFDISKHVLSPRPETEGLVDIALARLAGVDSARILDLGTGSGAILITLLLENASASGIGIDMSSQALNVARGNAKLRGLKARATWQQSNWFEHVDGMFDMIVSNPPYITDAAMEDLSAEVAGFDPDISLRGGTDGLSAYAAILAGAGDFLKPGGALVMEIGYDQGQSVPAMMRAAGFSSTQLYLDMSGLDRVVTGIWRG